MALHPDQERLKRWLFGPVGKIAEETSDASERTRRHQKMGTAYTVAIDQWALAEALAAAEKRGEIMLTGQY